MGVKRGRKALEAKVEIKEKWLVGNRTNKGKDGVRVKSINIGVNGVGGREVGVMNLDFGLGAIIPQWSKSCVQGK